MTQEQHPITPPLELLQQWAFEYWGPQEPVGEGETYIATQAARWGSDQELEACIEVILSYPGFESPELFVEVLRAARRPKPPSLKEQALEALQSMQIDPVVINGVNINADVIAKYDTIRRALEALPE